VILSGAIFSTYLYYSGKHSTTCIIGGLTYGFSAQVLIGGIWKNQGELAIIMALALLVIAVWKKGKSIRNVILTIFALAMYATQISIYYQLVYGVVIVGCIFVSYLLKESNILRKKAKNKKSVDCPWRSYHSGSNYFVLVHYAPNGICFSKLPGTVRACTVDREMERYIYDT